ncbi:tyrosine-type recombinase/integrase [Saccharicrinis fermentans]|uniref:Site-specific tyrosine recombinase XerC n=1 Tax=Saccharicrinis fermentans DSM 9555 = JCM 21142 TaxID=869213 RepID=W7YMN1_9BACT|nr:tyrosine-type recombinase/integrase [Saccharicrinis fermentans]GAF05936.1 site-specific tyrosine recombinase XerC [Saccharicrinis fermentans DSM 9555 = JCM 21142]
MQKKTSLTILEKAIVYVPELKKVLKKLENQVDLRGQEVINLKIGDVDFERQTIHIRQSKYKKDRIVPLSPTMAIGLKKYMAAENPCQWLFNGTQPIRYPLWKAINTTWPMWCANSADG